MKRYMALTVVILLILVSVLIGCAGIKSTPPSPSTSKATDKGQPPEAEASRKDVFNDKPIVLGFYTDLGSGASKSKESVLNHIKSIDDLAFFWYSFNETGKIQSADIDLRIKEMAQKSGIKVFALVHNLKGRQFDPQVAHKVLTNPSVRKNFISNLLNLAVKNNWDGIAIDMEKILPADRNDYAAFLSELQTTLKAKDKILNVSIPAKYHDDPKDPWSGAFDYAAIGKAADQVVLMTYEEHGVGTTQGPIASQGWVDRVINYAIGKIPKEKIIMGLPVYASNWASNKPILPTYISYAQAKDLARKHKVSILYDQTQQVPHYSFTDAGVRHEIYLEDVRSLTAKLDIAKKNQLRGIGIWRLGIEDSSLWTDVLKGYNSGHK